MVNKINEIIKCFLKNNAKIWEIGTNFYNSQILLLKNINNTLSSQSLNEDLCICIKETYEDSQNFDKNKFKMILLDNNITPITTKNKFASASAIRQYLQVASALGILDFNMNDSVKNGNKFLLLNKLNFSYPSNNLDTNLCNLIIESLIYSPNSPIKFKTNLGFTLFLSLLHEVNVALFEQINPEYSINPIIKRGEIKKLNTLFLNQKTTINFIKKVKGEHVDEFKYSGKQTYITCVQKILQKYTFEQIVDWIYQEITTSRNDFYLNPKELDNKNKKEEFNKIVNEIKNKRGSLRKEIQDNRLGTRCDQMYSDLINSSPNHKYISAMDACHIYDIKFIIQEIRGIYLKYPFDEITNSKELKENIEKLVDAVSDYNNGIFLDKSCHKLFDERIVWFDNNGYLKCVRESEPIVASVFGHNYKNIKIKDEVLTYKMRYYLSKRPNN